MALFTPQEYIRILKGSKDPAAWARTFIDDPGFFQKLHMQDAEGCLELRYVCANLLSFEAAMPGPQLFKIFETALNPLPEPSREQFLVERRSWVTPHWPTGLSELDRRTDGGGYAQSVVTGTAKLGKSMLAISAAMEAARAGWKVCFLAGENSESDTEDAFYGYLNGAEDADVIWENMRLWHVLDRGFDIPRAVGHLKSLISEDLETRQVLVVIDSINRISEMSPGNGGYFAQMADWGDYFRRCTLLSGGMISSLLVAEMNADHSTKGRRLEFSANLVVNLTPVKDSPEEVDIAVAHSRSTPSGKLGRFYRNWPVRRFLKTASA